MRYKSGLPDVHPLKQHNAHQATNGVGDHIHNIALPAVDKEVLHQLDKNAKHKADKEAGPDSVMAELQVAELFGQPHDHQESENAKEKGVGKRVKGKKLPDRKGGHRRRGQ